MERFAILMIVILLCFASVKIYCGDDVPVTLDNFRYPEYGEHSSDVPEMMIYGAKAKTVGVLTYLDDLRLEWFDGSMDKVKAFVTTPFGIYDRATKIVKGDREVSFKSESMTVEGVGFEAHIQKKMIKVSSEVKVTLIGDLETSQSKSAADENKKN